MILKNIPKSVLQQETFSQRLSSKRHLHSFEIIAFTFPSRRRPYKFQKAIYKKVRTTQVLYKNIKILKIVFNFEKQYIHWFWQCKERLFQVLFSNDKVRVHLKSCKTCKEFCTLYEAEETLILISHIAFLLKPLKLLLLLLDREKVEF